MWQKCPICNGTGNRPVLEGDILSNKCKVCEGKGIISTITGLPPKGVETFAAPKYRQEINSNQVGIGINNPPSLFVNKDSPWYNIVESYYNK